MKAVKWYIFPLLTKKYQYKQGILNYKIQKYIKILQKVHRFVQNFALQRQNKHAEMYCSNVLFDFRKPNTRWAEQKFVSINSAVFNNGNYCFKINIFFTSATTLFTCANKTMCVRVYKTFLFEIIYNIDCKKKCRSLGRRERKYEYTLIKLWNRFVVKSMWSVLIYLNRKKMRNLKSIARALSLSTLKSYLHL